METPPKDLICPISRDLFKDPVLAADGHSYERKDIKKWLEQNNRSPMTNDELAHDHLTPNHRLRSRCTEWRELHTTEAGLIAQLKQVSGELITSLDAAAVLETVRKIDALVECAHSRKFLILGPAGVAKFRKHAECGGVVNAEVRSFLSLYLSFAYSVLFFSFL